MVRQRKHPKAPKNRIFYLLASEKVVSNSRPCTQRVQRPSDADCIKKKKKPNPIGWFLQSCQDTQGCCKHSVSLTVQANVKIIERAIQIKENGLYCIQKIRANSSTMLQF